MKLKLSLATLFALTMGFMSPLPASADGDVACGTSGTYHVTGTEVVSSSNCTGSVVIDDTITSIGFRAFDNQVTYYGGTDSHANVTSLTLGSSLLRIESNAFRLSVGDLTSLVIPNSVTFIGSSAFYGAGSLTTLNLGTGVTSIANSAFRGTSSLTQLVLPPMLNMLGSNVFALSGITSLTVPGSLEVIPYESLSSMLALETLVISEGVLEIEDFAISSASSLTSLTLPNSLELIGNYSFLGMSSLTELVIPNGVTDIGDGAFDMALDLERLIVGSSVRNVGSDIFTLGSLTCFTNLSDLTQMDLLQVDDVYPACAAPQVSSSSTQAAAVYLGPVITGLSTRQSSTLGGDTLSFSGENLALVTAVLVAGTPVKITTQTKNALSIVLPAHVAGIASVVLVSPSSLFTFDGAVEYVSAAAPASALTNSFAFSSPKSTVLSDSQRASISDLVKRNPARTVTCTANYLRTSPKDQRIARSLASEACSLAKLKNPKIKAIVNLTPKAARSSRTLTLKLAN